MPVSDSSSPSSSDSSINASSDSSDNVIRSETSKRLSLNDDQSDSSLCKRSKTTQEDETNLVVRVMSEEFKLRLFPLLKESIYFIRRVDTMVGTLNMRAGSSLVIDVPADSPCTPDVFRIIVDFCYDRMEDSQISTANVVRLMLACDFLEMDRLKCIGLKYLENDAFVSFGGCLAVLSTFHANDFSNIDEEMEKSSLFQMSRRAFLRNIQCRGKQETKVQKERGMTKRCNWKVLVIVAKSLPLNTVKLIYQSILEEQFGFFWTSNDKPESKNKEIPLCSHYTSNCSEVRRVNVDFSYSSAHHFKWIEALHLSIDVSRMALLVLHLAKSIRLENIMTTVCFSFVCALLARASELQALFERRLFAEGSGLKEEIRYLEKFVGNVFLLASCGLSDAGLIAHHCTIETSLSKFKFGTLLSIVKHIGTLVGQERMVGVAKIFDSCLGAHLKENSLTVQQVLLIYREFPNDARPSHAELYSVFENLLSTKNLCPSQLLELSELLDYSKLSDKIVHKLWGEFGLGWNVPRLQERVVKMQQETHNVLVRLRRGNASKTIEVARLESELGQKCLELDAMGEGKKQVEAELDRVRHDLEKEKDKTTCQICFERPRDCLSLPCMHFNYCSECVELHHQRVKTCPTCRSPTTETRKCKL